MLQSNSSFWCPSCLWILSVILVEIMFVKSRNLVKINTIPVKMPEEGVFQNSGKFQTPADRSCLLKRLLVARWDRANATPPVMVFATIALIISNVVPPISKSCLRP